MFPSAIRLRSLGQSGAQGLIARTLFDFDIEAFNLLIEGGEGNLEVLGRFGLIPVAAFEAVGDDATLDLFHEVEEAGVWLMIEQAGRVGAASELGGKQIWSNGA